MFGYLVNEVRYFLENLLEGMLPRLCFVLNERVYFFVPEVCVYICMVKPAPVGDMWCKEPGFFPKSAA